MFARCAGLVTCTCACACVNARSCSALGKIPFSLAAAAARVTFLLGKVTKAVHATACAPLRGVTSFAHPALRKSRCPRLLPRALNAVRRFALRCSPVALSALASCFAAKPGPRHPGAGAQRMRYAQRELAHPCARTCAPCPRARLRCSALANATKVKNKNHSNRARSARAFALDLHPPSAAAGLRGKTRRVRAKDALTRRRPRMAIGAPRAGTRTRAAGAAVGAAFLWPLSLAGTAPQERREPRSGPRRGEGQDARSKESGPGGGSRTEQGNLARLYARAIVHAQHATKQVRTLTRREWEQPPSSPEGRRMDPQRGSG